MKACLLVESHALMALPAHVPLGSSSSSMAESMLDGAL